MGLFIKDCKLGYDPRYCRTNGRTVLMDGRLTAHWARKMDRGEGKDEDGRKWKV